MGSGHRTEDKWLWRGIGLVYLLFALTIALGGRGIGILSSALIVCLLGQLWVMHVRRELFSPRNLGGFTLLALIALLGCVFVAVTEGFV
jgi:hypothetical protein